jgi:hypothetical protein
MPRAQRSEACPQRREGRPSNTNTCQTRRNDVSTSERDPTSLQSSGREMKRFWPAPRPTASTTPSVATRLAMDLAG